MPIYLYQCNECHHQMEALQKMSDPKLVDCPECSAPAFEKQMTAATFKLKGTGWYETDFKNAGTKPEATATGKPLSDKSTGTATASNSAVGDAGAKPSAQTRTPKETATSS